MIKIEVAFDPANYGNIKNTEAARVLRELGRALLAIAGDLPESITGADAATAKEPNAATRRGRPPKDAPAAEPVVVAEPEKPVEENLFGEEAPASHKKDFTDEDAKNAGKMLIDKRGVDSLKKILGDMGLKKVTDMPKEKFAEFIAACETAAK